MTPDRFTIKTQEAIRAAIDLADARRNPQATPEHLLVVLLEQDGGIVAPVLRKLGVAPEAVRAEVSPALDALPTLSGAVTPRCGPPLPARRPPRAPAGRRRGPS